MSLKDVTPNGSESMFNRLKRSSFKIRYLYFVLVILAGLYYYMALPAFHYASMDFLALHWPDCLSGDRY